MYENAVESATMDALNVNIQWHCRVINDKVPVNLYDSRAINNKVPVNLYDSRAINNKVPVNLYDSCAINNKVPFNLTIVVQSTKRFSQSIR